MNFFGKLSLVCSRAAIVLLSLLIAIPAVAQFRLDRWKTHTSFNTVRDATIDSKGRIWAATTGGVVSFNPEDSTYLTFTNTEGLLTIDINTINYDPVSKSIFAGASDGTLEILDENTLTWKHFPEIRNSKNFPNPTINSIFFHDGMAYIAGGYGLAVFDIVRGVFVESITSGYDSIPQYTNTNQVIIHNDTIWVATDAGIAYAKTGSTIADPKSWTDITVREKLPDNAVKHILFYNDTLFAANARFISKFNSGTFTKLKNTDYDINSFALVGGKPVISQFWGLSDLSGSIIDFPKRGKDLEISGFVSLMNNQTDYLFVFYKENCMDALYNNIHIKLQPNCPSASIFSSLDVSPDGTLWSATDNTLAGRGFNRLNNGEWTRYNYDVMPEIKSNAYYSAKAFPDGRAAFSSWGVGFVIAEPTESGFEFNRFDHTNSPFVSVSADFDVAGEIEMDVNGDIWISVYGGVSNGPVLLKYDKNKNFTAFENKISPNRRSFYKLAIDHNGTKWLGSLEGMGLLYFNENNTPDNPNDDIYGSVTVSSHPSLIENTHTKLAVDNNGWLWVGSPTGICVIINPSAVLNDGNLIIRKFENSSKLKVLVNLKINDIHVDALNNKWLATPNGLWVLNPDGTEIIASLNTDGKDNPLTTNEIISVTTDFNSGRAFIGTRQGLFECMSLSVDPLSDYEISCYPQPYYPDNGDELVIDGLAPDTELKIVTVDGDFIQTINTSGRKAVWNGRNSAGSTVQSGVYLIIATSPTNNTQSTGKIAVIRQ